MYDTLYDMYTYIYIYDKYIWYKLYHIVSMVIASIYLHQYFLILKIMAHATLSVDYDELLSQCYNSWSMFQFSEKEDIICLSC